MVQTCIAVIVLAHGIASARRYLYLHDIHAG
jgi:hypothetical protein